MHKLNQSPKNAAISLLSLLALCIGLFSFPGVVQPESAGSKDVPAIGILDGMTFVGEIGPIGKPADVKDDLVFANGMFSSTECDKRCGYPPSPYFVRRMGNKIEFVSESNCTNKDAKISWRGTVENGTLRGGFTWTSSRWYWTVEKEFWFKGKIAQSRDETGRNR